MNFGKPAIALFSRLKNCLEDRSRSFGILRSTKGPCSCREYHSVVSHGRFAHGLWPRGTGYNGRKYDRPFFTVAWPMGEFGGMRSGVLRLYRYAEYAYRSSAHGNGWANPLAFSPARIVVVLVRQGSRAAGLRQIISPTTVVSISKFNEDRRGDVFRLSVIADVFQRFRNPEG